MSDDKVVDLLDRAKGYEGPEFDPARWMKRYELTDEEVEEMQDADFIIPNLIISSQVTVIAAQPGRGKTTIIMYECGNMVDKGYQVMYVNMDCGAGDVKFWHQQARAGGFSMITPHFKGADGIEEWLEGLKGMASLDMDMSRVVIVVDTLKKISDLMNKSRVKATMNLLRAMTAKGSTVICAAHCNKHRTPDGKLIFEGVGDVESDCDNLIYIESEKDDFGTRTATSEPSDKVRGIFQKRTWKIHADRTVEALDTVIDVAAEIEASTQLEKDATVIEIIKTGIAKNLHKRVELFEYACTDHKISRREFDAVLRRYCVGHSGAKVAPIWRNEKQSKENADYYILVQGGG